MSNLNTNAGQEEIKEITSLLEKLNKKQKNMVLATVRGAVIIAESEKEGAANDNTGS